jgi:hypothetical protein
VYELSKAGVTLSCSYGKVRWPEQCDLLNIYFNPLKHSGSVTLRFGHRVYLLVLYDSRYKHRYFRLFS